MRERKCFRCGKHLDFKNYIKNISSKTKEHLTKLWNSPYIEFFCCHCYNIKVKYQPYIDLD